MSFYWNPRRTVSTMVMIMIICLSPAGLIPSLQLSAQEESIEDLILALDEASSETDRKAIISELKGMGSKALIAIESPPQGISQQTRLILNQIKFDIEKRSGTQTTKPSRFTLIGSFDLKTAAKQISSQTGMPIVVKTDSKGVKKIQLNDVIFWEGMDKVLDQFGADLYRYSKPGSLTIIDSNRTSSRSSCSGYGGVLRIEATNYTAATNLSSRNASFDRISLNLFWEPKLRPYQIIFDHSSVNLIDAKNVKRKLQLTGKADIQINRKDSFKEVDLRFDSIPRSTPGIQNISGSLTLKTPVGLEKFRFTDLTAPVAQQTQRKSEMTVTLDSVKFDDSTAKVAMTFILDNPGDSLESHRGWMFQNKAYLLDSKLNQILPDKIMTTMQEKDKMGFVFTFEVKTGPKGYEFVYETPTSIREIPISWKLGSIKLN